MSLTNISIKHFRCFEDTNFTLSPGINFFYGVNGCGKTTMLESIYLFSSGKSFKSSNLASLIKHNKDSFYIKGFDGDRGFVVEVEKNITKPISVKLNSNKITTSKLARKFPCTLIHNETFAFANAAPDFRRKLLDRSIFIIDEIFSKAWFSYHRALKQRNFLLKNNRKSDIYAWNEKLSTEGDILTSYRNKFFKNCYSEFYLLLKKLDLVNVFDFFETMSIEFFQGWTSNLSLFEVLENNTNKDLQRKITTEGPHRSDIKFLIKKQDAKQFMSRGEQKFFSILWSCAQNEALKKFYNVESTLIIDDIKSELDDRVFSLFIKLLENNKNQVIFSCIDDPFSSKITSNFNAFKKFHVEQLG